MKIYIGADHGGFALKNKIIEFLKPYMNEVIDCGAYQLSSVDDYPEFAIPLAQKVAAETGSFGILICKSGIGMSIAANKIKGAYAALCTSIERGIMAREHNEANIVCLDAEFISDELNIQIMKTFIDTLFTYDDRHIRRISKIQKFEKAQP